ncbi:hypothetical protein D3C76_1303070 [compost metagenome]
MAFRLMPRVPVPPTLVTVTSKVRPSTCTSDCRVPVTLPVVFRLKSDRSRPLTSSLKVRV